MTNPIEANTLPKDSPFIILIVPIHLMSIVLRAAFNVVGWSVKKATGVMDVTGEGDNPQVIITIENINK